MSKSNNADQPVKDPADTTTPAGNPAGNGTAAPELPTVEELSRKLNIDAPVFAAVMETQKWGGGKRVPEADFIKAVKGFLDGSMGGGE